MFDCSISVIIPAYNVEKYIKSALDSLKKQAELPNEVIVINDGSTDGTLAVAESFMFPVKYQVVSIKNGGQGRARNLGVALASSEYVYFFDADDLLTEDFISSIKECIRINMQPDIVLFSAASFNDSEYRGSRSVAYSRGFSGSFASRIDLLEEGFKSDGLFCSPCLYVSKKSLWGGDRLQFGQYYFEDEAIFFPLIFSCNSFVVFDRVFFLRRNREESTMTMVRNQRHVMGALNCLELSLSLYAMKGISNKERWHIANRIKGQFIQYLLTVRACNEKISYGTIFLASKKMRNFGLIIWAFAYAARLDEIEFLRRAWKIIYKSKISIKNWLLN